MLFYDNERSTKNVMGLMKVFCLKKLAKVFEISVIGDKKENYIETIASYFQNNLDIIMKKFITYEEFELIKCICEEKYALPLKKYKFIKEETISSLEYIGILYSYYDFNEKKLSIPVDIRQIVEFIIYNEDSSGNYYENQRLIEMSRNLLDIYGIMPQDLLVDYIIQDTRWKYEIHEALRILWIYNFRYNLYYIDQDLIYYSTKIFDIKLLNEKLLSKFDLKYKYYNKNQLKTMSNRKLNYIEREIYVVLKRQFKSSDITLKYLDSIKSMIKNDMSSKEISEYIRNATKRMSQQGQKILEELIDGARVYYPLWTLKGYSLNELECTERLNDKRIVSIYR